MRLFTKSCIRQFRSGVNDPHFIRADWKTASERLALQFSRFLERMSPVSQPSMKSPLWRRRRFASSQWILLLSLAALPFGSVVASDDPFGLYSGECTFEGEPVHVELEIVRNEQYTGGGADALLSLFKNGQTTPAVHVTMIGSFRDVQQLRRRGDHSPPKIQRQFEFSSWDPSEAFGGKFRLHLEADEGGALKGTLSLDKREPRPGHTEEVPITLTRNATPQQDATASAPSPGEAEV